MSRRPIEVQRFVNTCIGPARALSMIEPSECVRRPSGDTNASARPCTRSGAAESHRQAFDCSQSRQALRSIPARAAATVSRRRRASGSSRDWLASWQNCAADRTLTSPGARHGHRGGRRPQVRLVGAAGVDDDLLRGERHAVETAADVVRLVAGNDKQRDGDLRRGGIGVKFTHWSARPRSDTGSRRLAGC